MAVNETTLANIALGLVGEENLTSLKLDAGKAAATVRNVLPQSRDEMFELEDWKFCGARAELSQLDDTPSFGYEYQYALPDNCLRIRATVDENGDDIQYKYRREIYISGSEQTPVLLCNQAECRIKYTVLITNVALWPGWFRKLVYISIAQLIAQPLTKDQQNKLNLDYMFKDACKYARDINGMEDADVDDFNVNKDLGNTDVLQAANRIKANQISESYLPGW